MLRHGLLVALTTVSTGTDAEKYRVMLAAYATDNTPGDMGGAMNVRTHCARSMRSLLTLMQSYLDTAHEVTTLSTSACVLNSEINMITDVLGGK
jgi:hypothetical protein